VTNHFLRQRQTDHMTSRGRGIAVAAVATAGLVLAGPGVAATAAPMAAMDQSKGQQGNEGQPAGQQGQQSQPGNEGQNGGDGEAGGNSASTQNDTGDEAKPDRPGNNGTVKIAPYGEMDGIPNNTPHVGCQFQVEWFGFDEGDEIVSTVNFAMQAPTEGDLKTSGDTSVFVGEDAAGGAGNDPDGSSAYTLSFTGEPHPQQGYHVKLTVETPYSQGSDRKSKVFWVQDCAGEETLSPGDTEDTEDEVAGVEQERDENRGGPTDDEVAGAEQERDKNHGGAPQGNEVAGVSGERPAGVDEVAGVSSERPAGVDEVAGVSGVAVPTQVAAGTGGQGAVNGLMALLIAMGGALAAAGAWLGVIGRARSVRKA
jgi:hypothetical protein